MEKPSSVKAPYSSSNSDVVPAAAEFERVHNSLLSRKRDLFVLRQRLAHRRLSGETIPDFRDAYLGLRREEEEVRFEILRLRSSPRIYARERDKECPKSARRLRRWLNLLMIIVLMAYFLLFILGG
jgi:hypothetical protein